MHYGISTIGRCRQNLSVCHLKETSVTVSLHLYNVRCFPTANWKRTSSSRGVLCHQQTGLFRLVLHGEFSLFHAGKRTPLLFLCRNCLAHNDFSRHVHGRILNEYFWTSRLGFSGSRSADLIRCLFKILLLSKSRLVYFKDKPQELLSVTWDFGKRQHVSPEITTGKTSLQPQEFSDHNSRGGSDGWNPSPYIISLISIHIVWRWSAVETQITQVTR